MADTRVCAGKRKDGSPCTATVSPPQNYCWWHDPSNAEKRSQAASKAARSKGSATRGELAELKTRLRQLLDDVVAGDLEKGRGSVAAQIAGVLIRAVEEERKIREQDELIKRIEELESAAEYQQRSSRGCGWGR